MAARKVFDADKAIEVAGPAVETPGGGRHLHREGQHADAKYLGGKDGASWRPVVSMSSATMVKSTGRNALVKGATRLLSEGESG